MKLLLRWGADPRAMNNRGLLPADITKLPVVLSLLEAALQKPIVAPFRPPKISAITVPPRPPKIILLQTGMTSAEKMLFSEYASRLDAEVHNEMGPSVTHVVTSVNSKGLCTRTVRPYITVSITVIDHPFMC